MDDVQFETLASVLEREGRLAPERALALLREATRSLADAHAAGILHCDVQPATLLVASNGRVLLAESPLARRQGQERQRDTPDTERLVSPFYYPPEAAHVKPLDVRTDLFLLGASFYHAMAGHPPFDGPDPEARALQYIRHDVPSLDQRVPGTPVLLNVLMHKLLRRDPAERYQSAEELLGALERVERMLQKRQPARAPIVGNGRAAAAAAAGKEAGGEKRPKARRAAAEPVAEAKPEERPKTRHMRPVGEAEAAGARKHPTTARAKAVHKPLWQSKPFIYGAAAGGFLLLVVVFLLSSGGGRQPDLAVREEASPDSWSEEETEVPAKAVKEEVKGPVASELPKAKPRTSTAVAPPEKAPLPKKAPEEPPKKRWQPIKGTLTGTETYEEFLKRTEDLDVCNVEDYIVKWEYAGPYSEAGKDGKTLFDVAFPPEKQVAGATLAPEETPKWAPMPTGTDKMRPWLIEFDKTPDLRGDNRAIYLRTRVQSPKKQEVQLWAGSDDSLKVWLNGQQVHGNPVNRPLTADSDKVKVTLNEGWNALLVKVCQGTGQWSFCLRFRGLDGEKLDGTVARPAEK